MKDNTFSQLLVLIPDEVEKSLFVVDENCSVNDIGQLNSRIAGRNDCTVLTNRFDLNNYAATLGLFSQFSDFDLSNIANNSLDNLFFRVPKERAVAHHIINEASRVLRKGGHLHLAGAKQEGIKTYIKNAGVLLGSAIQAKKNGTSYVASIKKNIMQPTLLDDRQYPEIREIAQINDRPVASKPGLFGWEKVDQGSALLAAQLPVFFAQLPSSPSVLDLGCGYGYLSIMANECGAGKIVATDNNAAAVLCCKQNLEQRNIDGEVIAADCGGGIDALFDAVVCHPPFHQGFDVSDNLGGRFVQAAFQHLKPGGKALFVANSFVPLEQWGKKLFSMVDVLSNNQQFKVVVMAKGEGYPVSKAVR